MNVTDVGAAKVLESNMISIFSPHDHITHLFDQFPNKQFYNDVEEFKKTPALIKIAFITKPVAPDFNYVLQFVDHCDIVLVNDGEFHEWHCLNSDSYSWKNVYWIGPGYTKKNNEYIIPFQQWLNHIQKLYRRPSLRIQLNRLNPYQLKPMVFDALLGSHRPPRLFIMEQIKTHNLDSKIISNIFSQTEYKNYPMDQLPGFVWEDDYHYADSQNKNINHIGCNINYHGAITSLGNIIPISTYNQAAFSILSETVHNNSVYMLTEKTAKVALGRRVFVAFAGQGFLQLVRDIGFQTFNGIIDESYDLIENDQDRWQAAFDQVLRLCESDQETILSQATPILEHNFDLMMHQPWQLNGDHAIQSKLTELIGKLNQT